MPELPEVESGRRLAERVGSGRCIKKLWCARDPIVFEASPTLMHRALVGARVLAVRRRGKQLWMELDRAPHPLFHFGMTGAFRVPGIEALPLASTPTQGEAPEWPPRFAKIRIWFDDGGELVMTNKRRLGRIRLREDPLNEPPLSRLGFDPLLDMPSRQEFLRRLGKRDAVLKSLLLDQSFAAGVGNWIADEVLFQAGLDPRRHASDLDDTERERLRRTLRRVVRRAVDVDADKRQLPRDWLFHQRWGRTKGARTSRGEKIEFLTLGGRTTAWVPERQG